MSVWIGAGILLALVLARLLWAALRPRATVSGDASAVYATQQEALARAAADGEVAPGDVAALSTELARATLEDAASGSSVPHPVSAEERYSLGLLVMLVLPVVAIPLYLQLGAPNPPSPATPAAHMSPAQMITELEQRIERAPQDPEPRMWLARVYMAEARYAEAVTVFEALNALAPDQPAILLQYADALAMTHQGKIGAKAAALIRRALELDPDNLTGLWLSGVAADQEGRAREALDFLQRARAASVATETPTDDLDAMIAEIETRSGLRATPATPAQGVAPAAPPAAAAGGARITVEVAVDAAAVADFPPDAVVYVLARAVAGPPMPLAVKRLRLADLPQRVVLDDSLAMAPQFKLSSVTEVIVTARVSRSGEPLAHSGDVEGRSDPLAVGPDATVAVTIATRIP